MLRAFERGALHVYAAVRRTVDSRPFHGRCGSRGDIETSVRERSLRIGKPTRYWINLPGWATAETREANVRRGLAPGALSLRRFSQAGRTPASPAHALRCIHRARTTPGSPPRAPRGCAGSSARPTANLSTPTKKKRFVVMRPIRGKDLVWNRYFDKADAEYEVQKLRASGHEARIRRSLRLARSGRNAPAAVRKNRRPGPD